MYDEGEWHFYDCQIEDIDAMVFVRTDLAASAPDRKRPWLFLATLKLKSKRSDGFTAKPETESLWEIEDRLEKTIAREWNGIYVGRYTMAGERTLLFYLPSEPAANAAKALVHSVVKDYQFKLDGFDDQKWNNYLQCLYPNDIAWMEIGNQPVLDRLEKHGDSLTPKRHTLHWLYFKSRKDREDFLKALKTTKSKFDVVEPLNPDKGNDRHGVRIEHQCSMLKAKLIPVQIELQRLAQEFGGEYDGFECAVKARK